MSVLYYSLSDHSSISYGELYNYNIDSDVSEDILMLCPKICNVNSHEYISKATMPFHAQTIHRRGR